LKTVQVIQAPFPFLTSKQRLIMKFPLWAYLKQTIHTQRLILDPIKFKYQHDRLFLERCFDTKKISHRSSDLIEGD